jgi:tetratricopeptide (TPR) repeat protein
MDGIAVAGAVVGWASGLATAFGGLWVYRHTAKRDAFQDHCSSYKERIAMREKEFEQASEGPDKDEKRGKLSGLREEYDQFLEAWQQKQELAKLAPRGAVSVDAPKLPPEQIAQLVELLAGSTRLPAILLTADDYFTRGNAYYEAGDYERALEAYNRALELKPDFAAVLNNRGNALYELKRHEDALKDFNRALELEPDDPMTLNNRGTTLDEMGRYGDALRDYDRSLELRPDYVDALVNRSAALIKMEHYDNALEDINHALELRPNYAPALYNRACAYSPLGRFEEALQDLEAAIKGDEKYPKMARTDEDFDKLRDDPEYGPRFRKLVGEQDHSEG